MLIPVVYPNGKHDLVKDFLLSHLIENKGITKFKRSDGWIGIDSADIRRASNTYYIGPRRRQHDSELAEVIDIF